MGAPSFCLAGIRAVWHAGRMQSPAHVHTCGNGLTAVVRPDSSHPVVSVQFWVRTGSADEAPLLGSGLSHLLEHMVFKGTQRYDGQALAEAVQALGGHWNAYTSTDRTVFYIDGPAAAWKDFVGLLAQLVFFPTFPEEELEKEKEVIRREMAMYADDPNDAAYRALIQTLFRRAPRRLPVLGERAQFDRLTRGDMLAYHARRYVPNNAFVVVAGDIDPEEAFACIERELASLRPAATAKEPVLREPRQWGRRLFRTTFEQPTSTLMLAWRTPDADHPDGAALTLLSHILGSGRTAWLYERFHDREGLVHDISSSLMPGRGEEGALVIEADVEPGRRDTVRDAILDYVSRLEGGDWTRALERAKRQMAASRLNTLATASGAAQELGLSWFLAGNPELMPEWHEALQRVTVSDLDRVARLYLGPERLTEVSVDPAGSRCAASASAAPARRETEELELPNGLRVILRPDGRIPMVHACLAFKAGAPSETEATAGINSLMAECLLKGTTTRSSAELAAALEDLGGGIQADTGNNSLTVTTRCLAEDWEAALDVLADVSANPTFPEEQVAHEREAMLADALDNLEDPLFVAFRELRRACYGNASYGNVPEGTPESIPHLTRDALVRQHEAVFRAGNGVLCVTGDFDPERVGGRLASLFSVLRAGGSPALVPTPPLRAGDASVRMDKQQAVVALALPGRAATSPDMTAMGLLNAWCSDMAGPVFTEIREKRGLAYYAASTALLGLDAGNFCLYAGTAPEQADDLRAALEELACRLGREGMPPEALERTRAAALSARLMAMQSGRKLCSAIAVDTLLGLSPSFVDRQAELIRKVTHDDMRRLMARVFDPAAPRAWATVKP